jgi:Nif11 domain
MKTLGEFLQRLEDDPLFENQAQAFNSGDELMAFVESEGYDFTLAQLTSAFKQRGNLPPEGDAAVPAPPEVSTPTQPTPEVTACLVSPATSPPADTITALPNQESAGLPREQSGPEVRELQGVMPAKALAEKLSGLFRGGGGRHRGFSPERLKNAPEEDS